MLRDELVDELGLLHRDMCAVECVCCGNKIYLLSRRGRCRECKSNMYSIQLRSLTLHNWHRIYYWIECISACPSLILDFTVLWPFSCHFAYISFLIFPLRECSFIASSHNPMIKCKHHMTYVKKLPHNYIYVYYNICNQLRVRKNFKIISPLPFPITTCLALHGVECRTHADYTSIHIAPLWSIDDGEMN